MDKKYIIWGIDRYEFNGETYYMVDYFIRSGIGMSPDLMSNRMTIRELCEFLQGAEGVMDKTVTEVCND